MKNMIERIVTILLIATLTACNNKKEDAASEPVLSGNTVELNDAQFKNAQIRTGKISKRHTSSLLKVNGRIEVPPQNKVSVSAPLGGYLKSTRMLEGMHVKKGDVLAMMEDQQYIQLQQDYLTAKAYLASSEKEFERQKDLNESKTSSDKVFEQAQAQYTMQKIAVKSLSEKLRLIGINPENLNENNISRTIQITSPIDGFVSAVKMNIGKYAMPTDILFELVNPADVHLVLTVFEKDVTKLYIGQKVTAYNNNPERKEYKCEILFIGQDLSQEGSAIVHCHFLQYDKSLIPGMFMNAEIQVEADDAYVMPDDAVVMFEGKQYVFAETTAKKYEMIEVSAQNSANGYTQVSFKEKKHAERNFVLKGAYTLLMTMKNSEE
jgi:membrane fusion protein, heavy metal efflux system